MQDENDLESRAQAAQDKAGKALYLNLGELLDEEYWRGFMLGIFIGGIAAVAYAAFRLERE